MEINNKRNEEIIVNGKNIDKLRDNKILIFLFIHYIVRRRLDAKNKKNYLI